MKLTVHMRGRVGQSMVQFNDSFMSVGAGLKIETPRLSFTLGVRGGHVTCTREMRDRTKLNALVENSLKRKSVTNLSRKSNQIFLGLIRRTLTWTKEKPRLCP